MTGNPFQSRIPRVTIKAKRVCWAKSASYSTYSVYSVLVNVSPDHLVDPYRTPPACRRRWQRASKAHEEHCVAGYGCKRAVQLSRNAVDKSTLDARRAGT